MEDLSGLVAIVTGAGRGIGKCIAGVLARCGATVGVCDLDARLAEATAHDLWCDGLKATARRLDVASSREMGQAVTSITSETGRLDIMVNNAGVVEAMPFLGITEEHWDRIFAVNAKGTLFGIQAAARVMIDSGTTGRIINIASVAGKGGRPLLAAYSASKAAIINLTQAASQALAPYRITVNSICPGVVSTEMGRKALAQMAALTAESGVSAEQSRVPPAPLGPEASPQDVAGLAAFLAGAQAGYITGQALNVDGGRCTH